MAAYRLFNSRIFELPPGHRVRAGIAAVALLLAGCSEPSPEINTGKGQAVMAAKDTGASTPVIAAVHYTPSLFGNYLAGIHARVQNDSTAAARFMDQVLEADPKNTGVLQMTFLLKLQDGAVAQAIPMARLLLASQPDNQLAGLNLISDAFRKRDFGTAKTLIGALDKQGLGELLKPLLGAWADAGLGNMDAALAGLEPLAAHKSFRPFYGFHRALIAASAGRDALAEKYFTELLGDDGNRSIRAAQAFGAYLETRDQYPRAAEVYRSFLQPVLPHPILTSALARNAAKLPARPLIDNAATGAAEVLYGLASVLSQDTAPSTLPLIYLRLAVYINPAFEEASLLLAGVLESLTRFEDAIAIYSGLPESSAQYETARIQIALNEDRAGRTDAGIENLRQYAAKYPDRADRALLSLADLLRTRERYAEAIPVYDQIISTMGAIKPQHWQMLYARGITLERAGNWALAERDLLRALELQPDQPNVLNYLAYSWIDKGLNMERAKTMIESAAQQLPDDGAIIDSLGWSQYRTGDFSTAVETLENAVNLMPQDVVINDHLGDAYWQVGRRLEAQFQWNRALSFDPAPDVKRDIEKKLQSGPDTVAIPPKPALPSAQKS
ncbi:MAG: tetratricopeptide repeat protein [Alphaproteobacteria bacterium]